MLDIETAIRNLDNLKFLEEKKPEGFYCSIFSREGIIILTNLRISFLFLEEDDELQFEHIIYNMVSRVNFNITNETSTLDINYAYNKHRFNFKFKQDILAVKRLLELYIPDKVHVDFLEEGEQKTQPTTGNDLDFNETQIINLKETRPLLFIGKPDFRIPFKRYLKKSLSIFILITVFYLAYPYLYSLKDKASGIVGYGLNFIEFQRCESEIFLIGQALNHEYSLRKSFPKDFPQFIRASFKSRISKDSARDPWGNLYRFQEEKNVFKIISDGPDKEKNTSDDLVKEFVREESVIQ